MSLRYKLKSFGNVFTRLEGSGCWVNLGISTDENSKVHLLLEDFLRNNIEFIENFMNENSQANSTRDVLPTDNLVFYLLKNYPKFITIWHEYSVNGTTTKYIFLYPAIGLKYLSWYSPEIEKHAYSMLNEYIGLIQSGFSTELGNEKYLSSMSDS